MRDYWNEHAYAVNHSMVTPLQMTSRNLFFNPKDMVGDGIE